MKVGFRKPSVKKVIRSKTTGAAKRKAKSTFSPTYGKRGVGYIKDPEKVVKDTVYKKTTKSFWDIFK